MLETLKNAFRIKDIRKKLFYTFCMMVVIRMGSQLPVPGVNRNYFSQWFAQQSNSICVARSTSPLIASANTEKAMPA